MPPRAYDEQARSQLAQGVHGCVSVLGGAHLRVFDPLTEDLFEERHDGGFVVDPTRAGDPTRDIPDLSSI